MDHYKAGSKQARDKTKEMNEAIRKSAEEVKRPFFNSDRWTGQRSERRNPNFFSEDIQLFRLFDLYVNPPNLQYSSLIHKHKITKHQSSSTCR